MANITSHIHLYNYCVKVCCAQGKKEIIEDNKLKFLASCKLFYNLHINNGYAKVLGELKLKSFADIFIQIVVEGTTIDEMLLDMKNAIGELICLQSDENVDKNNYPFLFPRFNLPTNMLVERLKDMNSLLDNVEVTNNFEELCSKYNNRFGIYMFFNENKEIIYIGKSNTNLVDRMLSSLKEKENPAYVMLGFPNTESDTNVYEVYYISKYKPKLNVESKNNDELTIELPEIEFTDLVGTFEKAKITNYKERLDNMLKREILCTTF